MHNYKELKVWQKAMEVSKLVFRSTALFPASERFGLVSQMNKSAVSVPSNIAEGAGWNSPREFSNFLGIAMGSCYELETQILLAHAFGYLDDGANEDLLNLVTELQKMLYKLQLSIKETSSH